MCWNDVLTSRRFVANSQKKFRQCQHITSSQRQVKMQCCNLIDFLAPYAELLVGQNLLPCLQLRLSERSLYDEALSLQHEALGMCRRLRGLSKSSIATTTAATATITTASPPAPPTTLSLIKQLQIAWQAWYFRHARHIETTSPVCFTLKLSFGACTASLSLIQLQVAWQAWYFEHHELHAIGNCMAGVVFPAQKTCRDYDWTRF